MPVNPNSHLRKVRKAIFGWKDGGKFYTSLKPRGENAAKNEHASATEALQEASSRHLPIVWDDPGAIA
jgi:hypothetical protein